MQIALHTALAPRRAARRGRHWVRARLSKSLYFSFTGSERQLVCSRSNLQGVKDINFAAAAAKLPLD